MWIYNNNSTQSFYITFLGVVVEHIYTTDTWLSAFLVLGLKLNLSSTFYPDWQAISQMPLNYSLAWVLQTTRP